MTTALLDIDNLGVRFGGLAALDEVSFQVAPGSVHGLIGPNGAGKTTAFNLISGLVQPTAGRVTLDGKRLDGLPTWARAQSGLSRTFQNIRMFQTMSALENVMTGMHLHLRQSPAMILTRPGGFHRSEADARDLAMELLDLVGLRASARRPGGELPYGEQRRLEIARALASKPKLLLLDEPAAGMNPSEKLDLGDMIARIRARGVTLLLVEHDMHFVMRLCDRITVLNFGRRIADGTPAEIRRDPQVIEAYLGGTIAARLEGGA